MSTCDLDIHYIGRDQSSFDEFVLKQRTQTDADTGFMRNFMEKCPRNSLRHLIDVARSMRMMVVDNRLDLLQDAFYPFRGSPDELRFLLCFPHLPLRFSRIWTLNDNCISLLSLACRYLNVEMVEYLVESLGADVNHLGVQITVDGVENISCFKHCLLELLRNAMVNTSTLAPSKKTIKRLFSYLVEQGADLSAVNLNLSHRCCDTILKLAVSLYDEKFVHYLVKAHGVGYHAMDFFNNSKVWPRAILQAVATGNVRLVQFMIAELGHFDCDREDQDTRCTLLSEAIESRSFAMVRFVMEHMNGSLYCRNGFNALFSVVQPVRLFAWHDVEGSHLAVIRYLVEIHLRNIREGRITRNDAEFFWLDWVKTFYNGDDILPFTFYQYVKTFMPFEFGEIQQVLQETAGSFLRITHMNVAHNIDQVYKNGAAYPREAEQEADAAAAAAAVEPEGKRPRHL